MGSDSIVTYTHSLTQKDSIVAYASSGSKLQKLDHWLMRYIQEFLLYVYAICLPTEHQGVHKNLFRNACAFQD